MEEYSKVSLKTEIGLRNSRSQGFRGIKLWVVWPDIGAREEFLLKVVKYVWINLVCAASKKAW